MRLVIILVALFASSCCQTVWLGVSRRESAPARAIVLPEVKPGAIPIPKLENRFLPGFTVDRAKAEPYTDQLDPRSDEDQGIGIAFAALDAIWGAGDTSARLDALAGETLGPLPGTLKCRMAYENEICPAVLVPTLTSSPNTEHLEFRPKVARVTFTDEHGTKHVEWHGVVECAGIAKKGEDPPDPTEDNPCGSTPLGTRFTMTRPINATPKTEVQIELATEFSLSKTVLTFVHLSDTQLRDTDVKLTNPVTSAQLDKLVESFEYDEDQELYGAELAEAIVATINQEVVHHTATSLAPSFMIHTGDSIDSSTKRELRWFHDIMDRLTIPWFNVIGNHDVLVFGNFLPAKDVDDKRCATQESIVAPYFDAPRWLIPGRLCVPEKIAGNVGPHDTFIAGKDHAVSRATFIDEHFRHARAKVVDKRSLTACKDRSGQPILKAGPNDLHHGFDLSHATERPGYYAFALDLDIDAERRRGIAIVLNTEDLEPNEGGNSGRIRQPQVEFLEDAFKCVQPHDLVFMFGHHALGEIKLPAGGHLRDHALMNSKNIVGYFYGHDHKHGLCRAKGACTKFWELESGSLIEHPQEGRLVRIKTVGAGIGFIETVVFTERLADENTAFAKRVAFARAGADRDFCLRNRCSDDKRVRRKDGQFTHARLFFKLP